MSLTSNIDIGDSAIRQFFGRNLPKLRNVSRVINKTFHHITKKADSSALTPYEKTVAGGAIDYRIRFLLNDDYASMITRFGAIVMGERWSRTNGIYEKLLTYRSQAKDERRLYQISIIFSYLDGCFRSHMESFTLTEIGSPKIEQMLDRLNPVLVDDLMIKRQLMQHQPFIDKSKNFVLGHTFDGSLDVGGADADLIIGGVLIDFKSTAKWKLTSRILRQLIGYWLLDYSDRFAVKEVGVYFSRYGALWTMNVAELLFLCGFESEQRLRDLWSEDRRRRLERMEKDKSVRQQPVKAPTQTKEEAREKRKLSLAKRQWRLAGAQAMLTNPANLKKWQLAIIRKFASGKTDYSCMGAPERTLLDEQSARALMPFEEWHNQPRST